MNQISSSEEHGCMDTFLALSGDWEIPEGYEDYCDGYIAEIYNEIPDGVLALGFEGTCWWSEQDLRGRFCTTVVADDEDFKMLSHDVSYYLDPNDYFDEEGYYYYPEDGTD